MTISITLTTTTTPPTATLDMTALPTGTASLSVLRLVEADILAALSVRGARDAVVGSTAHVTDWDAPTGVPITYRVTALAAGGTVLETLDATASAIDDPGESYGWLSDPLDASSARKVTMMVGTDSERSYVADVSFSYGATDGLARASVGVRRAAPVPLVLHAIGASECSEIRHLLVDSVSLCFRPPSHLGLPAVVYGIPPEIVEVPQGLRDPATTPHAHWAMTLVPTRGPGRDMIRAAWTYADILALGLTYRQLFTAYGLPVDSFGSYRNLTRAP